MLASAQGSKGQILETCVSICISACKKLEAVATSVSASTVGTCRSTFAAEAICRAQASRSLICC